jgi:hypothetical protein
MFFAPMGRRGLHARVAFAREWAENKKATRRVAADLDCLGFPLFRFLGASSNAKYRDLANG